ncbi:phosphopyruvate hydratase [Candidatus Dojkabacteria bacterium CG_4_10_14_3_um_filter_Dojkabacteria_WS6_41_9]|uniref:Enolase n=1 Tax=Candidatus Dojkabacteria bacterium CG_4_10_14_0_2_um_filter_Dojkabacteria_WS6_41_15 TaxID=2014249 RepID=A0A2M7W2Y1_9BACT|nr:MAG: phosphopyruvate hydratase [Candidatus Dojkabacteria bacterium CG_4_10_14_3_um_filter_Dojkabacteria_WS6_41_9]PJA15505.1 MAG: phosphopyruvate hydratase [Candidatus Dojkabacteria bacterium CG_4_10_14_0_2_um_filter_Dojkabacteria_WS6_41_15]
MKIAKLVAYEVLASGGYPTVEVKVTLDTGAIGIASVPYGASAGKHEAVVLTDQDKTRWNGNGVLKAVDNILNTIVPAIKDIPTENQIDLDTQLIQLDGTLDKAKLGGNAILAVSLAVARATANAKRLPLYRYLIETYHLEPDLNKLPQPMTVIIEGGKHADESTDFQEFCVVAKEQGSVAENVRRCLETYHQLKGILKENKLSTNGGNEGAFAPNGIPTNEKPLEFIVEAIKRAGYTPGGELGIAIDAAASEFYNGNYELKLENRQFTSDELIAYYSEWLDKYPFVSLEDMLAEDDWEGWVKLNQILKAKGIKHIGDDLTVTNIGRLRKAIENDAISGIIIKPNQIGTLSETIACCQIANEHGLITITSHRGGGETNDHFIADLAVAVGSAYVKVGPTRGERVSKYNRLMEIERELRG